LISASSARLPDAGCTCTMVQAAAHQNCGAAPSHVHTHTHTHTPATAGITNAANAMHIQQDIRTYSRTQRSTCTPMPFLHCPHHPTT
jgi:hypothetical protein